MNEILYGSKLYILYVETSSYVISYRRGDVWNVGFVNVQLFAVVICAAENYFKRMDNFFPLTHRVANLAIEGHAQM